MEVICQFWKVLRITKRISLKTLSRTKRCGTNLWNEDFRSGQVVMRKRRYVQKRTRLGFKGLMLESSALLAM